MILIVYYMKLIYNNNLIYFNIKMDLCFYGIICTNKNCNKYHNNLYYNDRLFLSKIINEKNKCNFCQKYKRKCKYDLLCDYKDCMNSHSLNQTYEDRKYIITVYDYLNTRNKYFEQYEICKNYYNNTDELPNMYDYHMKTNQINSKIIVNDKYNYGCYHNITCNNINCEKFHFGLDYHQRNYLYNCINKKSKNNFKLKYNGFLIKSCCMNKLLCDNKHCKLNHPQNQTYEDRIYIIKIYEYFQKINKLKLLYQKYNHIYDKICRYEKLSYFKELYPRIKDPFPLSFVNSNRKTISYKSLDETYSSRSYREPSYEIQSTYKDYYKETSYERNEQSKEYKETSYNIDKYLTSIKNKLENKPSEIEVSSEITNSELETPPYSTSSMNSNQYYYHPYYCHPYYYPYYQPHFYQQPIEDKNAKRKLIQEVIEEYNKKQKT
jgi:hypothetical protein